MNNLIIIKGDAYDEIKLLLQDLHRLPLYECGLQKNIDVELYKLTDDLLAIRANRRLGGTFFSILLYYLDDPENKKHNAEVRGYITGLNSNELKNKKLMMYVSKRGAKHSVFAISECGEHYRIGSTGKATLVDFQIAIYRNPDINLTDIQSEIIPIIHLKEPRKLSKEDKAKIEKIDRKVYYLVVLLILLIGYIVFSIFL